MGLMDSVDRSVINTILRVGSEMGMNQKQLLAGLAGALVESGARNLNYGDRDSLGVFQQRPSMGWGSPAQVRDPEYASRKFFSELKRVWKDGRSIGANVQAVQRSAFPDRYDQRLGDARKLFASFGNEVKGIEVPISDPTDPDSLASDLLPGQFDDDEFDLADPNEDQLDDLWANAVQVMGDEVRGQYDPNGDLFDEPGDADELVSPDEYERMLSGQQGLIAGAAELNLGDTANPVELSPSSISLQAGKQQAEQQRINSLVSSAQSRQRAMDALEQMSKGKTSMGSGGRIGPASKGSIPSGLQANTANGARIARSLGFGGTIGGIGGRSYKSDHPHGNAIDLMTGLSKKGQADGWQLANYFHSNRGQLKVKYIIFDNKIASSRDNWRWRVYNGTPDGNTSPTALHEDHVHISFY